MRLAVSEPSAKNIIGSIMEGASDPADMLAVAAVICPVCNTSGTLVLGYGPEADADDADVLASLGEIDG